MESMLTPVNRKYNNSAVNREKHIELFLFSVYFSVMLNFYTYKYVQLASQTLLVAYIWLMRTKGKYEVRHFRIVKKYLCWYGLFVCWAWMSLFWTEQVTFDVIRSLITILRIAVICTSIIFYLAKTGNLEIVFKGLIYGGITFVFITIAVNPVSSWMHTSFISFNGGFVRTGIAEICLLYICFIQFSKYIFPQKIFPESQRCIYMLFFMVLMILTGARKQILQLVFVCIILTIFKRFKVKRKYLIYFTVICCLFFPLTVNEMFYERIIVKFIMLFKGFAGSDPSTIGRLMYIKIGLNIAKDHFLLGQGVNAFRNYLMSNSVQTQIGILSPTYSHCNYIEILDSFGLVGLVLFYRFHFRILAVNWKYRRTNTTSLFLLCVLFMFLVGDVGTINYFYHIIMYFYAVLFYLNYRQARTECT